MPKKLSKTFTLPVIYRPKKGGYKAAFVFFRFYHEGKWRSIKRKPQLPESAGRGDYNHELENVRRACLIALEQKGWNPVTKTYFTPVVEKGVERLQKLTFSEALDFAYQKKLPDWKPKTASDYRSKIKFLKKACDALEFSPDPLSSYKLAHFKLIMDQVNLERKLSKSGWNIYRDYLSTLVSEMVQYGIIELNYIHHVKTKTIRKADRKNIHRPPTPTERFMIVNRIKQTKREYYRFLSLIYGCGIRPEEIRGLRIRDVHKIQSLIKIPKEVGKTGYREATVPAWVMNLLDELNLDRYKPSDFLFSGKGHLFFPGPNQMSHNAARYWWNKIVRDGLGLHVNQYGLKKLSGDDLVKLQHQEGVTGLLGLAKTQFGHATEDQTAEYTSEHLRIQHEILKNKMPVL